MTKLNLAQGEEKIIQNHPWFLLHSTPSADHAEVDE